MTDNLTLARKAKLHCAKELAAEMDGMDIGADIAPFACKAKAAGLVIVYGASDDLIEFDGFFRDEAYAHHGKDVALTEGGFWYVPEGCDCDPHDIQCPYLLADIEHAKKVTTYWCATAGGPSWTYKTDIPHATFNIMEDGKIYCQGLIFHSDELKPKLAQDLHDLKALAWDATTQLRGECNDPLLDKVEAYMAAIENDR